VKYEVLQILKKLIIKRTDDLKNGTHVHQRRYHEKYGPYHMELEDTCSHCRANYTTQKHTFSKEIQMHVNYRVKGEANRHNQKL
jgi:hypothetical protein